MCSFGFRSPPYQTLSINIQNFFFFFPSELDISSVLVSTSLGKSVFFLNA